jgi:mRNA interferase RelE/StbE
MAYEIVVVPAADKAIAHLPRSVRARITERLVRLAEDPRPSGSVKLSGVEAYRIRVGDYRIIYQIHDQQLIVLVIDVGHRREVYRRK